MEGVKSWFMGDWLKQGCSNSGDVVKVHLVLLLVCIVLIFISLFVNIANKLVATGFIVVALVIVGVPAVMALKDLVAKHKAQ